jgi:hypothetical protein
VAEHGEDGSLEDLLLEELYSFTGKGWEQEDDITLLTLRRSSSLEQFAEKLIFRKPHYLGTPVRSRTSDS